MSTYLLKVVRYRPVSLPEVTPDVREFVNAAATFSLWGAAFVVPFLITFA